MIPQMATADGGIIAQPINTNTDTLIPGPATIFDSNGNATGQNPSFADGTSWNWPGNRSYSTAASNLTATNLTPPLYAPTYAALSAGNQSANGTSIWQVISPIAPSTTPQKQLPPPGAT